MLLSEYKDGEFLSRRNALLLDWELAQKMQYDLPILILADLVGADWLWLPS